jgi:hypothetical protein
MGFGCHTSGEAWEQEGKGVWVQVGTSRRLRTHRTADTHNQRLQLSLFPHWRRLLHAFHHYKALAHVFFFFFGTCLFTTPQPSLETVRPCPPAGELCLFTHTFAHRLFRTVF